MTDSIGITHAKPKSSTDLNKSYKHFSNSKHDFSSEVELIKKPMILINLHSIILFSHLFTTTES